jgi:hypothetical protein
MSATFVGYLIASKAQLVMIEYIYIYIYISSVFGIVIADIKKLFYKKYF